MSELKAIDYLYERKIRNGSDPYKIKLVDVRHPPVYLKSEADKVIAHHKHKRCVAMAKFCHVSSVLCEGPDSLFYRRWFHKWYELAEKFKEAE